MFGGLFDGLLKLMILAVMGLFVLCVGIQLIHACR